MLILGAVLCFFLTVLILYFIKRECEWFPPDLDKIRFLLFVCGLTFVAGVCMTLEHFNLLPDFRG